MDNHDYSRTSVLEWDENDVHAWFSKLGYPQYEHQIKGMFPFRGVAIALFISTAPDHRIRGDVLCLMDPEYLKEVGISTIGQRLSILKSVYLLKLAQNIPIGPDHYIPPCPSLSYNTPPLTLIILSSSRGRQQTSCINGGPHSFTATTGSVTPQLAPLRELRFDTQIQMTGCAFLKTRTDG